MAESKSKDDALVFPIITSITLAVIIIGMLLTIFCPQQAWTRSGIISAVLLMIAYDVSFICHFAVSRYLVGKICCGIVALSIIASTMTTMVKGYGYEYGYWAQLGILLVLILGNFYAWATLSLTASWIKALLKSQASKKSAADSSQS
jgi:hypothetical protein